MSEESSFLHILKAAATFIRNISLSSVDSTYMELNSIVSQLDSYSRMPELISARSPGCIRHGTGRIEQYDLCKHLRVGNLS